MKRNRGAHPRPAARLGLALAFWCVYSVSRRDTAFTRRPQMTIQTTTARLTTGTIADRLGVTRKQIRAWVHRGLVVEYPYRNGGGFPASSGRGFLLPALCFLLHCCSTGRVPYANRSD